MIDEIVKFSILYYKEVFIALLILISILYTKNRKVAMAICTVLLFYYFYMILFEL